MAGFDVGGALLGVVGGCEGVGFGEGRRDWRQVGFARRTLGLGEVAFEIIHAPAAARPCSATLADLTGAARLMDADEVHNLPLGDVEAVANGVVEVHEFGRSVFDAIRVAAERRQWS